MLAHILNYDYIASDCYVINKKVKDIPFYKFNITENPDIEYNFFAYGGGSAVIVNRYRMKRNTVYQAYVDGYAGHNLTLAFFPKNLYLDKDKYPETYHPEFYNANQMQICFNANGNSESREMMINIATEKAIQAFLECPSAEYLLFAPDDNMFACSCDACKNSIEEYGSIAGSFVKFVNDVRVKFDEWLNGEGKQYYREFDFLVMAYIQYQEPPVKVGEDGNKYATIKCVDGVYPFLTPIFADFQYPIYHEKNEDVKILVEGWQLVDDRVDYYLYYTNFRDYLSPYSAFNGIQESYKLAAVSGSKYMYNQGQTGNNNYTGWNKLFIYLESKLGWNVNSDLNYYTDKFFSSYYGLASSNMRKWYDEYRAISFYNAEKNGLDNENTKDNHPDSTIYHNMLQTKYWPLSTLQRWLGYADDAIESISALKDTNPTLYEEIHERIILERISVEYLMIELYSEQITAVELLRLKEQCKQDITKTGVSKSREALSVSVLFNKWGV